MLHLKYYSYLFSIEIKIKTLFQKKKKNLIRYNDYRRVFMFSVDVNSYSVIKHLNTTSCLKFKVLLNS